MIASQQAGGHGISTQNSLPSESASTVHGTSPRLTSAGAAAEWCRIFGHYRA